MKNIDKSILKYIPKKLHNNVTHADKWKSNDDPNAKNLYYYCIAFEFEGEPETDGGKNGYTCYNCIGVADIKWYCQQVLKGRRGCDW